MKKSNLVARIVMSAALTMGALCAVCTPAKAEDKVVDGVYVDDVNISNMTREEAQKALDDYAKTRGEATVSVYMEDRSATTTLAQLGYVMKDKDYIEHGINIGTKGNVIEKYKELKDVENGGLKLKAEFEYDDALVRDFVESECTKTDIEAIEPTMVRKSKDYIKSDSCEGKFDYTDGNNGKAVDVESTYEAIVNKLNNYKGDEIVIDAKVNTVKPKYSKEALLECTTMLGTYNTNFSKSSAGRKANVKTATGYINGTVIYPGEEFSTLSLIAPFNEKRGYEKAGSYAAGKVVDTYGGGVCQVSTTLYNAVMLAELEISDRSCHSMVIDYVPVSFDAAVSSSSGMDFKFINNTEAPVYIEGYTENNKIYFSIYGKETRASNRIVKYKQVITDTIDPGGEKVTKDSSKPVGYRKVTQNKHVGYKAELYKQVYVDGVLVEESLFNKSSYKASPKYVTIGTKETTKPSETPATTKPADTATTQPAQETPASEPAATKAPAQKPAAEPSEEKPAATKAPAAETPAQKPAEAQPEPNPAEA